MFFVFFSLNLLTAVGVYGTLQSVADTNTTETLTAGMPAVAETLINALRKVYAERMTAAAIIGGDEPLRQMEQARDYLVDRVGFDGVTAATLVRSLHVEFCDSIGHEVPAEYRAKVVRTLDWLKATRF